MRIVKTLGLVMVGVVIGLVVAASSREVDAQIQLRRLVAGESVEWAGNYAFRFIKDTRTGACYLASLSAGEGGSMTQPKVTAITRADDGSCF